jgi:methionyl aminopeptidase
MIIETEDDLTGLRRVGRIVALVREEVIRHVQAGMVTAELDDIAAQCLALHGARSAPILTYNFPGTICISINEEAAHGIPGNRKIRTGDLVNVDISAELDGYFADTGATIIIGQGTAVQQQLCQCTQSALTASMTVATAGNALNQISQAISAEASKCGFVVIKNLCGHGIGRNLHEKPDRILNYYSRSDRNMLTEGLVLAVEPFISTKAQLVKKSSDGWTLKVPKGNAVAQYEHTIVVTKDQPLILTQL